MFELLIDIRAVGGDGFFAKRIHDLIHLIENLVQLLLVLQEERFHEGTVHESRSIMIVGGETPGKEHDLKWKNVTVYNCPVKNTVSSGAALISNWGGISIQSSKGTVYFFTQFIPSTKHPIEKQSLTWELIRFSYTHRPQKIWRFRCVNLFMPTVPTFAVRETDVSRHNGR